MVNAHFPTSQTERPAGDCAGVVYFFTHAMAEKEYIQLELFTADQLADMERAPEVPGAPFDRDKIIATGALLDCLSDAGYNGPDAVYKFLTGQPPQVKKPRKPKT